MQLPKSFTTVTTFSKIFALTLFVLLPFVGFYLGIKFNQSITTCNQTQKTIINLPRPTTSELQNLSITSIKKQNNDLDSTLKVYRSSGSIKYELSYPQNWTQLDNGEGIMLDSPEGNRIWVSCPRTTPAETKFPNPYSWENNEGGYTVKYMNKTTINDNKIQQYIWAPSDGSGSLSTDILRKTDPVVCTLMQLVVIKGNYKDLITSQKTYNQILNSFVFLK